MHLQSMRFWMITYVLLTFFDVIVTYFFISSGQFGIVDEGNAVIRNLMEQFGIWQGLTIYIIQEFLFFFLVWGCFYYIILHLIKNRSQEVQHKIDILIFNLGVPFIIMANALLHLFAGLFWIVLGTTDVLDRWFPLNFVVYITIFFGIAQAYYLFRVSSESPPSPNPSLVSK